MPCKLLYEGQSHWVLTQLSCPLSPCPFDHHNKVCLPLKYLANPPLVSILTAATEINCSSSLTVTSTIASSLASLLPILFLPTLQTQGSERLFCKADLILSQPCLKLCATGSSSNYIQGPSPCILHSLGSQKISSIVCEALVLREETTQFHF